MATLRLPREFRYEEEGWGLAYDGTSLIQSDGTDVLTYLAPERDTPTRKLAVTWNGQPLHRLNFLDLTGLGPSSVRRQPEAVLNGIAYDPATGRRFVGGKL